MDENLKNDSKEVKNFFSSFFKSPLVEIKRVTSESGNKLLKAAVAILVIWIVAILISDLLTVANTYLFGPWGSFSYLFKNFFKVLLTFVKDLVAPFICVALLSGLTFAFRKDKSKSFLGIASGILIAKIPVVASGIFSLISVVSSVLSFPNFINNFILKLCINFSSFCNVLSVLLLFFAIKNLSGEEKNENYFWKFALIMGIYYAANFVLSYLGIYI